MIEKTINNKTNLELYNEWIKKNEDIVCLKIKKIVSNLVNELKNSKRFYFNKKQASGAIIFIERFCHLSTGEYAGQNFKLELWQKAFIEALFGFYEKETNIRRFKEALLVVGRGNGKSTLASAIALKCLLLDNEKRASIYTVATKKEQAKIIFDEVKSMIRQEEWLNSKLKITRDKIEFLRDWSHFQPLASEDKTLDGLNPYVVILDELAAMKKRDLYDVIKSATSKRKNTLMLLITTSGSTRESIYDERYEYGEKVLNNIYQNDNFLPWIYELDNFNEWKKFKNLYKANPNLGISKNIEKLKEEWETAINQPLQQPSFLTRHCNIASLQETSLFNFGSLQEKNNKNVNLEDYLKNKYCTVGIDLSQTMDLTAVVILIPEKTGDFFILPHFFIPRERAYENEKEDKVLYSVWEKQGYITFTLGSAVNRDEIIDYIIKTIKKYNLICVKIGYDRYYADYIKEKLEQNGFSNRTEIVTNGIYTISPLIKSIAPLFYDDKIIYNNHPIFKWNLDNTKLITDSKENVMPIKKSSRKRIDGFMALLFAYKMYINNEQHFKIYQTDIGKNFNG